MSSASPATEATPGSGDVGLAAVTGWAIHVPGLDELVPGVPPEPACSADNAHEVLGRKGLLYKEPATRLALCAVHRALGLPDAAARPSGAPDPRAAVVASSNLGNVQTVHEIVRTLQSGVGKDVSPLDAPNASSNVIASTVAIWFRLGGPNLMVCSGSTSGLDAVAAATLLLRGRRANRVVVVGVEPDDEVAALLHARRSGRGVGSALRAGAAALVLEPPRPDRPAVPGLGHVQSVRDVGELRECVRAPVVVGPAAAAPSASSVIDITDRAGDFYGALGVLQVALAAALLAARDSDPPAAVAVVCGDRVDGWRAVELTSRKEGDHGVEPR
jgi:3-oxoacyl-[acyl-carrier-protein] synthase II